MECYQSEAHGHCSEAFYRDCVLSKLGDENADPEARFKMLEVLSRIHNSELEAEDNELGKSSSVQVNYLNVRVLPKFSHS